MKARLLKALERARLLAPAFALWERALSIRPRARAPRIADDGLPIPPPSLVVRVAGTADAAWFLEGGRLGAETVRAALERTGTRIEATGPILDFGCGCGRVIRRWAGLGVEIHGTDRDRRAVAWCGEHLGFARFEANDLAPPLPYAAERFGLAYAFSVLTHLPEDLQLAWMHELHRVLRPAGWLVLSTHGAHYLPRLAPDERAAFEAGRLVVRWREAAGSNLCAAYHPRAYVERELLPAGFELVEFVEEGARGNPFQDLYVLRKR